MHRFLGPFLFFLALLGPIASAGARSPTIQHEPPPFALRGQPLIIRARVTGGPEPIRSVKLYYTASRDVAPFEVPMDASGGGVYIAVLAPHLLAGVDQFSYYIEAIDANDMATETRWYTVRVRAPEPGEKPPPSSTRPKWLVPAAVGGAAAVVIGAAVLAANNDGGDDGGTPTGDVSGTYAGSVELIVRDPGVSPTVTSRAASLYIAPDGRVVSDTLHEGRILTGQLSGRSFTLTTTVSEPGVTGQITYSGSVLDGRILGRIEGTRTTAAGEGTYSGSFSMQKQ